MKKIFAMLLAVLMVLSVMSVTAMAAEPLTFTINSDIDEEIDCRFSTLAEEYKDYDGKTVPKDGMTIPLNEAGYVKFGGQLTRAFNTRHDPKFRGYRLTIGESTLEILDDAIPSRDYYYLKEFIEANGGTEVDQSYIGGLLLGSFSFKFNTTKNVTFEFIYDPSVVAVTGISMEKTTLELPEGESEQLAASVLPENASLKNITWASKNPEVATVENGKVTGISAGTATIVATAAGRFTAECTVTVTENLDEKAAKAVEELIAAIGDVTKDSGSAIRAARKAYNALTAEQKDLVSKEALETLVKAEAEYDRLITRNEDSEPIHIGASEEAKDEQNPNTGAPVMSVAPAVLVLAAAAVVLKKRG